MEAKKQIDKQIVITIISTIIFVLFLITTVVIVVNSLFGYMRNTINVGDFVVDYRNGSRIQEKLQILSNANGLQLNGHEITITNNSNEEAEYYLYIKDYKGKNLPETFMVSLNDYNRQKASSIAQDDE